MPEVVPASLESLYCTVTESAMCRFKPLMLEFTRYSGYRCLHERDLPFTDAFHTKEKLQ